MAQHCGITEPELGHRRPVGPTKHSRGSFARPGGRAGRARRGESRRHRRLFGHGPTASGRSVAGVGAACRRRGDRYRIGRNGFVRRFWQAADAPLVVTTPEPVAIMECYATIKVLLAGTSEHCRANADQSRSDGRAGHGSATAALRPLADDSWVPLQSPPVTCPRSRWHCRRPRRASPMCSARPIARGARAMERLAAALWPVRRPEAMRASSVRDRPLGGVNSATGTLVDSMATAGTQQRRKKRIRAECNRNRLNLELGRSRYLGHPRQPIACQTLPFA